MLFTFNNIEYSDMIFIYGFCGGNARAAAAKYRLKYPDRRRPDSRIFYRMYVISMREDVFPEILPEPNAL